MFVRRWCLCLPFGCFRGHSYFDLLCPSFGSFHALFSSKQPWISLTLWGVDDVLEVDGVLFLLRKLPASDSSLVLLPPQVGEQVHLGLDQHTAHLTLLGDSVWLNDGDALIAGTLLQTKLPGLLLDLLQVLCMPLCCLLLLDLYLLLQLLLHPLLSSAHCAQPLQPLFVLDCSTHLSLLPLHSLNLLDAFFLLLPSTDHF